MNNRNGWTILKIPAIATNDEDYRIGPGQADVHHRREGDVLLPEREPKAALDEIRTAVGTMTFAAQWQQNPVPPDGNVIKRDDIQYFDQEPQLVDMRVASWDTASTIGPRSSYSSGQLWAVAGSDFYLLENVRGRWEAPDLRLLIIEALEKWKADATLIEETELGRVLVQDIRDTTNFRPLLSAPRTSKQARLQAQAARFQAKQVHLPRNAEWLDTYLTELLGFPFEPHDDQVDATSLALEYMVARTALRRPLQRRNPIRRDFKRA